MSAALITALTANIATFSCGTVITWSSPELDKLSDYSDSTLTIPLDKEQKSWVSSFMAIGAIFGPFVYGYLSDMIGRKWTILLLGVPFMLAPIIQAFSTVVALLYVARFLSGLATGGLFTVMPNYIGELSDSHNRGSLGSILNVELCAGMLFSYLVGPYLGIKAFNCILAIFPVIFAVSFFIFGPESAYYLVQKNQHVQASAALQKVRGPNADIEEELNTIQMKIKEAGNGSFFDIFKSKGLTKAFIISVGLIIFQQFSGINAILFYSQNIFKDAGVDIKPEICSIIIGVVQFATSFVTPLTADKLGRKILLMISAAGCVASEGILGIYSYMKDHDTDVSSVSFLPILCLILYIITYSVGYGPLPWMIMGEIFPSNVKAIASSVTAGICWILGFLITKYFQSLVDAIGMGPCFWIFTVFCGVSLPFIYFFLLETKGKSLHQIQDELEN